MKQAKSIYFSKSDSPGVFSVISAFILILLTSGYIVYQFLPKNQNFVFIPFTKEQNIYILQSVENENYLKRINISPKSYIKGIKRFAKKLSFTNTPIKIINEHDIKTLNKNDILFILDDYYISEQTLKNIENFLKKGGNLLFNYHFGYFKENRFVKASNIEKITGLKYITEAFSKNNSKFFIPKILSPLLLGENGKRHDLIIYGNDLLPIFESSSTPDAIITNWAITSTPILNGKMLKTNQSGIIWHGFYKKGKWFYFSFPGYVFLDMPSKVFKKYFTNIFSYMQNGCVLAKYPFIDSKNAVFISEDTEYKYENMIRFAKLAHSKNIPVTLFCVAKLAQKYKKMTKIASDFNNVEIGSHSYSHTKIMGENIDKVKTEIVGSKKILENITEKKIYGFRPPREEIDKTMENFLREAGYEYLMEKTKYYLLPKEEYKHLITISRHGTDDYIYLMNLEWNKEKILAKIIQETEMLTSVNAVYTLSIHTHLLSYKSNIEVIKEYFDYLKAHRELIPLKGREITSRIKLNGNIKLTKQEFNDKIFIYINNKNDIEIKNFTLRIYWPNLKKINLIPEISSVKIDIIRQNGKEKYTDVRIKELKPYSTISLILENSDD